MTDETTWLTPAAHLKLQEELTYLQTEGRQTISDELVKRVRTATSVKMPITTPPRMSKA